MNVGLKLRSFFCHVLRTYGLRFPYVRKVGGGIGLGRLIAPNSTVEQIVMDGDVNVELDLSVSYFRYLYFHHDLSNEAESVLIRHLLEPKQVFVDVGVHIGYFVLLAAKYGRHVYAFKPNPSSFACLQRNRSLNPTLVQKLDCLMVALGDTRGTLTLYTSPSDPSLASLKPIETSDPVTEVVKVDTLDRVLEAIPIHFIKVDVEGAEIDVLDGARGHISSTLPIVICELFEVFQQRFGHTCRDIVSFFTEYGYQDLRIETSAHEDDAVKLTELDVTTLSTTEVNNGLFVPADRVAEVMRRLNRDALPFAAGCRATNILFGYGYYPATTAIYLEKVLKRRHSITYVDTPWELHGRPGYAPDMDLAEAVKGLPVPPDLYMYIDRGLAPCAPRGLERLSIPTVGYLIDAWPPGIRLVNQCRPCWRPSLITSVWPTRAPSSCSVHIAITYRFTGYRWPVILIFIRSSLVSGPTTSASSGRSTRFRTRYECACSPPWNRDVR